MFLNFWVISIRYVKPFNEPFYVFILVSRGSVQVLHKRSLVQDQPSNPSRYASKLNSTLLIALLVLSSSQIVVFFWMIFTYVCFTHPDESWLTIHDANRLLVPSFGKIILKMRIKLYSSSCLSMLGNSRHKQSYCICSWDWILRCKY